MIAFCMRAAGVLEAVSGELHASVGNSMGLWLSFYEVGEGVPQRSQRTCPGLVVSVTTKRC